MVQKLICYIEFKILIFYLLLVFFYPMHNPSWIRYRTVITLWTKLYNVFFFFLNGLHGTSWWKVPCLFPYFSEWGTAQYQHPLDYHFCVAFVSQRHNIASAGQFLIRCTVPVWVCHSVQHYSPHILLHILFICCDRYKYSSTFFVCFHDTRYSALRGTPATNRMLESFIRLKTYSSQSLFADKGIKLRCLKE